MNQLEAAADFIASYGRAVIADEMRDTGTPEPLHRQVAYWRDEAATCVEAQQAAAARGEEDLEAEWGHRAHLCRTHQRTYQAAIYISEGADEQTALTMAALGQ
jgi:hypothetical protein